MTDGNIMDPSVKDTFSVNFLKEDFNQCFQMLRHYDLLNWEITKFSFVELLISVSCVWTLYTFSINPSNFQTLIANISVWLIPIILSMSYIFSLLASFLISRNRVYFVKTAKYLNEHRQFSLSNQPLGFTNETKYYTSLDFPNAFDPCSTHLVSLYVILFIGTIFLAIFFYFFFAYFHFPNLFSIIISIFIGCLSFIINLFFLIIYLKKQDKGFGNK